MRERATSHGITLDVKVDERLGEYVGDERKIKQILLSDKTNYEVTVKGWVRTFRNNQFIALNDGSTNNNLQIVIVEEFRLTTSQHQFAKAAVADQKRHNNR